MHWTRGLALALASALLLSLPFTGRSCLPVWFALGPVFYAVAAALTWRATLLHASTFSLLWCWLTLNFTAQQVPGAAVALTIYSALYYIAALSAVRWLARRGTCSAIFGVAAVWTLIEIFRSVVPVLSFPWLLLGHATGEATYLRQAGDLLGVYGLSFLVALVNGVCAFVLPGWLSGSAHVQAPPGTPGQRRWASAGIAGLLLAAVLYGHVRVASLQPRIEKDGPVLALLQGCVYQKFADRSYKELQAQLDRQVELHRQALQPSDGQAKPAVICWAETMVPGLFNRNEFAQSFLKEVRAGGVPTVTGGDWIHPDDFELTLAEQRWSNSAFFVGGDGEVLGRYAKRKLVPFGEYVPWKGVLPFVDKIQSVTRDTYVPGEGPSPVCELGGVAMAFNLCVEDVHPDLAREAADNGAELLMNLTNDGWFKGTYGPAAHLMAARFRSIEVRRPLVRVANSGHSVQVDPLGTIEQNLAPDVIGVSRLSVKRLTGAPERTWSMVLGEGGPAVLFALVIVLTVWLERPVRAQLLENKEVAAQALRKDFGP